jgi:hypothetical protein
VNKLPEHTLNAMANDDSPGGWSNQTVKPMAAEILELRAENERLQAIVETPIKLPRLRSVYYLDANDNFNPYAYLWDLHKNIREHGLTAAKDE